MKQKQSYPSINEVIGIGRHIVVPNWFGCQGKQGEPIQQTFADDPVRGPSSATIVSVGSVKES